MGRRLTAAIFALTAVILAAFGARADGPVVVELFTSQGCSSCPPADEYLGRIADRDDVIALSLHVDYWDYLGWRDVFGAPAHTARQRAYAARMKERMVYTPQIVVQGAEAMVGSYTSEVEDAILRHQNAPRPAQVALAVQGGRIVADIVPAADGAVAGLVRMVWFSRAEVVGIRAGENRGRDITYHNVVKGWSDLGAWKGGRIMLTLPKPMEADGVAVLVQDGEGGPILGAARLMLTP